MFTIFLCECSSIDNSLIYTKRILVYLPKKRKKRKKEKEEIALVSFTMPIFEWHLIDTLSVLNQNKIREIEKARRVKMEEKYYIYNVSSK